MKLNSPQFKALQKKWYQKLKRSGFEDIEDDKGRLYSYHAYKFPDDPAKQRYYELASHLLNTFPFTSRKSRAIWARHSEGQTNREIAEALGLSEEVVSNSVEYVASHIKDV